VAAASPLLTYVIEGEAEAERPSSAALLGGQAQLLPQIQQQLRQRGMGSHARHTARHRETSQRGDAGQTGD
jgi:hypothetical protein